MTSTGPTAEQIQQYERDGFLIVERWLSDDEVERTRERFHACFEHEWETGLAPDEVNYTPGVTPPDRTRQLCNVWKADRWLAHVTLAERNARFAAKLAGAPGMRLLQDNMIWKPPSGKALLAHQDAAYVPFLEPPNMTTCWMALDETAADTGTIYYAPGSHAWGSLPTGDTFHAPEDWLGWMNEVRPEGAEVDMVPIEVPPGGAAFHHGLCFHGSPPNERPDADRRAIISHMVSTETTWHPTLRHPLYSRYMRPGELEMDEAGDVIPADGEIVEGIASVDESAVTGESAPVIRESGGDRSGVTGGTRVLSDRIVVRVTANPGETFLDRMIALVEGAERQRTPNEIALSILLAGMSLIFLVVCAALVPMAALAGTGITLAVLAALFVSLIPTTIGALLSAIGIAGMNRLVRRNVLATSGRAVEAAGDVSVLLLDKTGTITLGNRQAARFLPVPGVSDRELAEAAQLSSLPDETPEGRSIVVLAKELFDLRGRDLSASSARFIAFSAETRMSGVDLDGHELRKGAGDAVRSFVTERGGTIPAELGELVDGVARAGSTPLVVCQDARVLGVVELKDVVKDGIRARFEQMRQAGIRTVMITGDNPLTAAAIAAEAGVDDFLAEATPEAKLALIRKEQEGGQLVAMTGDGTNDAPALAQADVGVAMNAGTSAAKEAGNMVDLDSNPTKLLDIVEIGKQLLITRGALTTFSIANDLAKYFAIIPAIFMTAYPQLDSLNILDLHSPHSAILSAIIFNAVVIIALVPLALRGVAYRPSGAASLLRRNVLIYGLGGVIVPFIGIKLIDILITALGA